MGLLARLSSSSAFELLCILQLSIGSNLMFAGYDTNGLILESVLHSVNERRPQEINEYAGYYGMAVGYTFLTLASFFVPLLVRYAGPKWTIFMGSMCFTIYLCSFLYLNSYIFFCTSALAGIGYAMFYGGYGCYVTEHSTPNHLARNSSITWSVACCSAFTGGIVLLIVFRQNYSYSSDERFREFSDLDILTIFGIFSGICFLSNITFFFMPSKKVKDSVYAANGCQENDKNFRDSLLATFKAFSDVNIWLLAPSCLHLGILITFLIGPYPTSLVFTQCLSKSKILVPLFGIMAGCGELTTAVVVTYLSPKYRDFGKIHAVVIATVASIIAYVLAFIATPQYAPLRPTTDGTILVEPNIYMPLLCGYLLGMADCCWNTSRNCYISWLLPNNCAEGFAISKIFQSLASCTFYFLSSIFDLYTHLAFLTAFLILTVASLYMAVLRQGGVQSDNKLKSTNEAIELKKEDLKLLEAS